MAGALLGPPRPQLGLGALLDTARARGYSRHGEMFSAADMAALAQELLPCRAELLQGGLGGPNRGRVLQHLRRGRALLVPYDEDSNHGPCCRRGHKAHWALINGLLLAVPPQQPLGPRFQRDPEIPNVFHAQFGEGAAAEGGAQGDSGGAEGESLFGEGALFGEGSHSGGPRGLQEGSGGAREDGEGSQFGEGSQAEDGSRFGEGSQAEGTPDLGRGSHFGAGSHPESVPDLSPGSRFGERFQAREGSGSGEGSRPDALPDLGRGSNLEEGSKFEEGSPSGGGSYPESVPDLGRGSRFGAGSPLVLALQGKSPRPQLWALPELGASNAQLSELSPRRWGGGFVLPPGGVRAGLGGRAVLLHPIETPPQ
ncbi:actin maturation protease-like isoform X3 [Oenanthe melanoleuca]|nr:actin maturation protease-like isoform X3 [Oenanthe melanoleuca]